MHRSINHEHVVRFHAVACDTENYYLLLEKCNNRSLRQVMKSRSRVTEDEVRYWISQLLSSLAYLHENHICHRDLKLDNIFLHERQVKLGDFGFSVRLAGNTKTKTFCGTPNYIAPEVVARTDYSFPIDVWAVGVLVYTMTYGTPPFETAAATTTYQKISVNDYAFPEVDHSSDAIKDVIRRCLQLRPEDRPTCAALLKHPFFNPALIPSSLPLSSLGYAVSSSGASKKRTRATDPALVEAVGGASAQPLVKRFSPALASAENKENSGNNMKYSQQQVENLRSSHNAPSAHQGSTSNHHNANANNARYSSPITQHQVFSSASAAVSAVSAAAAAAAGGSSGIAISSNAHAGSRTSSNGSTSVHSTGANATTKSGGVRSLLAAVPTAPNGAVSGPKVPATKVTASLWDQETHETHLTRITERLNEIAAQPAVDKVPSVAPPSVSPHQAHAAGHHWIVKWLDYSQRFGLSFQFCDGTIGVLFIDSSSLLTLPEGGKLQYTKMVRDAARRVTTSNSSSVANAGANTAFTSGANQTSTPSAPGSKGPIAKTLLEEFDLPLHQPIISSREHMKNRVELLDYFSEYMKSKLAPSSGLGIDCESESGSHALSESHHTSSSSLAGAQRKERLLGLLKWFKTDVAIIFLFTNYTVQINFYDHVKLVITLPDLIANPTATELITVVSEKGQGVTRTPAQMMAGGVLTSTLISKLQFAAKVISSPLLQTL